MNKIRRTRLRDVIPHLNALHDVLADILDEEEEKHANRPESLIDSPAGDAAQEAIDALLDFTSSIEEAIESINSIAGG